MDGLLDGMTSIVTGANRGIGLAIVETFAKQGADVWACCRTKSDEIEDRSRELSERYGIKVSPVYFDVTDSKAVKEAVMKIHKESGKIDVLVNNAGTSIEKTFGMTSIDEIKNTMDVNYYSIINLCQIVSRFMVRRNSGSIINVASVAGTKNENGGLAYGSSKAAVRFATRTMAMELGNHGIRVNSVSPGFIDTDMWKKRSEDAHGRVLKETSLGRQGMPSEVANTVLFLASSLSSFVTAQDIIVDGGRYMGN